MKAFFAPLILAYLRFFAKLQLQKNAGAKIIGITGSAGKTGCQTAVVAALGKKIKVKSSRKANSESGIPLDILGLSVKDYSLLDWSRLILLAPFQLLTNWRHFDAYVVEMGIDSPFPPKNMSHLLTIIQPNIGIFLNAKALHSEAFDQLVTADSATERDNKITDLIAAEKGKLIQSLAPNGLAIVNRDDARVWQLSQKIKAKVLSFSTKQVSADLLLTDWSIALTGTRFVFKINLPQSKDNLELNFKHKLIAHHYAQALSSAILLALELGLSPQEIKVNLEKNWQLEPGRSTLIAGYNNSYLLDSSYNASGMLEMIELSAQLAKNEPKITRSLAILGDMRELGQEADSAHRAVAELAAKNFEIVYLVGPLMHQFALPILQKAVDKGLGKIKSVKSFVDSATAGRELVSEIKAGDLILLKGSQNTIFIEKAVEILMAKPQTAKQILCRQSDWWLKVKNS